MKINVLVLRLHLYKRRHQLTSKLFNLHRFKTLYCFHINTKRNKNMYIKILKTYKFWDIVSQNLYYFRTILNLFLIKSISGWNSSYGISLLNTTKSSSKIFCSNKLSIVYTLQASFNLCSILVITSSTLGRS